MYACATELALLGNLSIKTFNGMGQQVLCDIIKLLTLKPPSTKYHIK